MKRSPSAGFMDQGHHIAVLCQIYKAFKRKSPPLMFRLLLIVKINHGQFTSFNPSIYSHLAAITGQSLNITLKHQDNAILLHSSLQKLSDCLDQILAALSMKLQKLMVNRTLYIQTK